MNAIEIKELCKSFREKTVLDHVSATMETGKIHGLVGDNGSGKSVLLKCVCGLMPSDGGEIRVLDIPVRPGGSKQAHMGIIIEHPGFLGAMSGWRNLKYLAGIRGKATDAEIRAALERVELADAAKKRVGKYSLGMRQRLAIAQAIMEDPPLLIMDEPFNGLDKKAVANVRSLFLELKKSGKTLVLASHNPADIELLCDDVFEMEEGKLRQIR